ncbi:hypothetical protein HK100_012226, partial [Physocladia obscura]
MEVEVEVEVPILVDSGPEVDMSTSSADERRLILELEFVQCLANPKYLQFLAQHQYFNDPAFLNYLKYLLYWKQPEYAQLVIYPYCLEILEYLQHESFRKAVALESTVQLIHQKEYFHWQHWRNHERRVIFQQQKEAALEDGKTEVRLNLSIIELKAYLKQHGGFFKLTSHNRKSRMHRKIVFGVPAYFWPDPITQYQQIPSGSIVVINPENGILAGQSTNEISANACLYTNLVSELNARGLLVFGYVPTAYFNHIGAESTVWCQTWERIEAQVAGYFATFGVEAIAGIFFDEVAPKEWDVTVFSGEFASLREVVRRNGTIKTTIAFNVGVANPAIVDGLRSGDILLVVENKYVAYKQQAHEILATTEAAHAKGAKTWYLIHGVASVSEMEKTVEEAQITFGVDYIYVTDLTVPANVWGELPKYWAQETRL